MVAGVSIDFGIKNISGFLIVMLVGNVPYCTAVSVSFQIYATHICFYVPNQVIGLVLLNVFKSWKFLVLNLFKQT